MAALLAAPGARRLVAGELEAVVLPEHGMLCASLRHRGAEMLRRVGDLDVAAAKGSSAGIPLLYPWANRLSGLHYQAAGRVVELDPASPLLHMDSNGLPMHGVPWSRLVWEIGAETPQRVAARLEWSRPEWLAVFPFPHRVELVVTLDPGGLRFDTTLRALAGSAVPVCFGFHPYLGLPELPREQWRLELPPMRRLRLDARGIPTGDDEAFAGFDAPLGATTFDDGFAKIGSAPSLSLRGGGRRIRVEFIEGYTHAQVFAPPGGDTVALEPMAAPADALVSGRGLRIVAPGDAFHAAFRIAIGPA
jgi:aldose 1-epimerase